MQCHMVAFHGQLDTACRASLHTTSILCVLLCSHNVSSKATVKGPFLGVHCLELVWCMPYHSVAFHGQLDAACRAALHTASILCVLLLID